MFIEEPEDILYLTKRYHDSEFVISASKLQKLMEMLIPKDMKPSPLTQEEREPLD